MIRLLVEIKREAVGGIMFDPKFLTLFYKGTKKQRYIDLAGNTALFLGLFLPFLTALAASVGFLQSYAEALQTLNFCGFADQFLKNIPVPYPILHTALQHVSIVTILTAVLLRVTKCPIFGAVLIVDALAGYVASIPDIAAFETFNRITILDHLNLWSIVFLILIVTAYSLGTAASVHLTLDCFAYRKQIKAIKEQFSGDAGIQTLIQSLPYGKRTFDFRISDKDMIHRSLHGFVRSGSIQPSAGVTLADRTGRKLADAVITRILSDRSGVEAALAAAGSEFVLQLDLCDSDALQKAVFLYSETE